MTEYGYILLSKITQCVWEKHCPFTLKTAITQLLSYSTQTHLTQTFWFYNRTVSVQCRFKDVTGPYTQTHTSKQTHTLTHTHIQTHTRIQTHTPSHPLTPLQGLFKGTTS